MKQLSDTKLVSEQLQLYRGSNMPPQQAPINNKSVIIEDMLCREGRASRSSNMSTEKLSTLIDQGVVQTASSSRKKLPQCSSMNYYGHDHGDKCNQQQPVVTAPQDFGYPFQMQTNGRRGKAPPIDPFSGENPEVTIIEEWLRITLTKIFSIGPLGYPCGKHGPR